jgi:DNA-binding GntR family transcriptional regulator
MSLVIENNIISAESIAARLRREMSAVELEAGTRLRSLRKFTSRYDTSYITMRKAINILCDEGFLTSRRGAGVYFCSKQDLELAMMPP